MRGNKLEWRGDGVRRRRVRGLRRPPRGWLLPLCGVRFLWLHRLLVRGHHGLESAGRRRPLRARRGLDEHRRRIRPRRIELERIVRDGVLIAHRRWGWWWRRVVFPGPSRHRRGRRQGARGALFDRGLRRRTLRRAFRLLALFGEPRERVEHARAAPAAHVTLRNAQVLCRHQQSQGTLRTDRKHGLEPRPVRGINGGVPRGPPSRRSRRTEQHQSTGHKHLSRLRPRAA